MSNVHVDGGWWALVLLVVLAAIVIASIRQRGWFSFASANGTHDHGQNDSSSDHPAPVAVAGHDSHDESLLSIILKAFLFIVVVFGLLWIVFFGGWHTITGSVNTRHYSSPAVTKPSVAKFIPLTVSASKINRRCAPLSTEQQTCDIKDDDIGSGWIFTASDLPEGARFCFEPEIGALGGKPENFPFRKIQRLLETGQVETLEPGQLPRGRARAMRFFPKGSLTLTYFGRMKTCA